MSISTFLASKRPIPSRQQSLSNRNSIVLNGCCLTWVLSEDGNRRLLTCYVLSILNKLKRFFNPTLWSLPVAQTKTGLIERLVSDARLRSRALLRWSKYDWIFLLLQHGFYLFSCLCTTLLPLHFYVPYPTLLQPLVYVYHIALVLDWSNRVSPCL